MLKWITIVGSSLCLISSSAVTADGTDAIEFASSGSFKEAGGRSFSSAPTKEEQSNVRFIIETLADKPTPVLLLHQAKLKEVGGKINHLHPLRYLECIFSDESMKVGMHNIRRKSFVWETFISNLAKTFIEEASCGNIKEEYVRKFAASLGVEYEVLAKPIREGQWQELVHQLITHVPRATNYDRYDM